MRFVVQVISSHSVFAASVSHALAQDPSLRRQVSVRTHYGEESNILHLPALFLLDLCCPGPQPGVLCGLLRRKYPGSKFLCLIAPDQDHEEYMLNLFFAGVEGIVCLKQRWHSELRRAVREILNGQLCIPPLVLQKYARETNSLLEAESGLHKLLTAREVQVAHLALRQFSTRSIACELDISERTVKFHIANIFLKTGASNRRQLTAIVTLHRRNKAVAVTRIPLILPAEGSSKEPPTSETSAALGSRRSSAADNVPSSQMRDSP
jgi:DNA-binding NarL/FixJ family response regulator